MLPVDPGMTQKTPKALHSLTNTVVVGLKTFPDPFRQSEQSVHYTREWTPLLSHGAVVQASPCHAAALEPGCRIQAETNESCRLQHTACSSDPFMESKVHVVKWN